MTRRRPPRRLYVLGSTGSIGTQTLEIVERHPELYRVSVLSAGHRVDDLVKQALKHRPALCVIADETLLPSLREALQPLGIECAAGANAVCDAVERPDVDMVVTATVGYSGLAPTLRALRADKDIALANKETMVVAGQLVCDLLEHSRSHIYPVDSEHSAIFQCLQGEDFSDVERLIITASGGPFLRTPAKELAHVTVKDALRHPRWSMGAKITVDSATMLNKAFEIIEAHWLFGFDGDHMAAVVHPQSIVHSMVEFKDGAVKAQLGVPDMRLPIAYALGYSERLPGAERPLTLADMATLTFEEPDAERFPLVKMGHYALERGGNTACVINAANEVAVDAFLRGLISFQAIADVITDTLAAAPFVADPSYDDLVATNADARRRSSSLINS